MANPFQDKFLKAGLASKKQVHKAKIAQNKKQKELRRNKGKVPPVDKELELVVQRQKEQVRKSNALRDQKAKEKELSAQIKQLVEVNRVKMDKGDLAFNFTDSNKIKKLYLSKSVIDQLSRGSLGIVKVEDKYEVVPADTACKIRDRLPEALLVLNEAQELDPNDPYAEFPIPDDLEW